MKRQVLAATLAILLTPLAAATPVLGEVHFAGSLRLPAEASVTVPLHALHAPDVSRTLKLDATFARVDVTLMEARYASVPYGPLRPSVAIDDRRPQWSLHDVHLDATPRGAGWIGLQANGGLLSENAPVPVTISPVFDAVIGNAALTSQEQDAEHAYFHAEVEGQGLAHSAPEWRYDGVGYLKLWGPTVTLRARENTTTFETGEFTDPASPGQIVRRWIQLDFEAGNISAECETEILSVTLDASWEGEAVLDRAEGQLAGEGTTWTANGTETITGPLRASARPTASRGTYVLAIEGEMVETSMSARAPASPLANPSSLLIGIGILAFTAGGIGILIKTRARRSPVHLHPEDYARLADDAADSEDYERAARFAEEARRRSPTSRRLALDHAYYANENGDTRKALAILELSLLRDDPDAHLLRARILLATNEDDAAHALKLALELAPTNVLDIETDESLMPLVDRADVREAMRRAHRRLT